MNSDDSPERLEPFDPSEREQPVVDPGGWLTPAELPPAYAANATRLPMYDLRPLTMGEVLDRTFSVYRSKFWLFVGISAAPGIFQSIATSAQLRFQQPLIDPGTGLPHFENLHFGTSFVVMMVAYVLLMATTGQTYAATTFAVGEVYLGRPTTIAASFQATMQRWLAYIGIMFWQMGSMLWIMFALAVPGILLVVLGLKSGVGWAVLGGILIFLAMTGGVVLGYIQYLRNSMGVCSAVMERLTVRASMRRSKVLTSGAKGRIFVVVLITGCLGLVIGVLQTPMTLLMEHALQQGKESIPAMLGTLVLGFIGHALVAPVMLIGVTLMYFDQRVRKEAFDIEMLLDEEVAVEGGAAVVAADSSPHEGAGI